MDAGGRRDDVDLQRHGQLPDFLSADDTSEVSDAYSPGVLARLVAVKDRCDPDNVFRINNNVAPSARA